MLPDRALMLKVEKVGRRRHMANVVQYPAGLRYTHRAPSATQFGPFCAARIYSAWSRSVTCATILYLQMISMSIEK